MFAQLDLGTPPGLMLMLAYQLIWMMLLVEALMSDCWTVGTIAQLPTAITSKMFTLDAKVNRM